MTARPQSSRERLPSAAVRLSRSSAPRLPRAHLNVFALLCSRSAFAALAALRPASCFPTSRVRCSGLCGENVSKVWQMATSA